MYIWMDEWIYVCVHLCTCVRVCMAGCLSVRVNVCVFAWSDINISQNEIKVVK